MSLLIFLFLPLSSTLEISVNGSYCLINWITVFSEQDTGKPSKIFEKLPYIYTLG